VNFIFVNYFRIENIFIDILLHILSDIQDEYYVNIYDIPDIPIDTNCQWMNLSKFK
jgi:hypothetical protein